ARRNPLRRQADAHLRGADRGPRRPRRGGRQRRQAADGGRAAVARHPRPARARLRPDRRGRAGRRRRPGGHRHRRRRAAARRAAERAARGAGPRRARDPHVGAVADPRGRDRALRGVGAPGRLPEPRPVRQLPHRHGRPRRPRLRRDQRGRPALRAGPARPRGLRAPRLPPGGRAGGAPLRARPGDRLRRRPLARPRPVVVAVHRTQRDQLRRHAAVVASYVGGRMSERQRGTLELGAGDAFPLDGLDVRYDETATALVEESVRRGEAILTAAGALAADTGEYTGRSPRDKFIVRNAASAGVAWGEVNQPMEQVHFDRLLADMHRHARGLRLHAQHLYAGADPRFRLPVRVVTEYAWHALFARNLFLEPEPVPGGPPRRPRYRPGTTWAGWTVVDIPSFRADPERHGTRSSTVIAVDFARRLVLIGNTEYAGEMKKSVFSVLNLALPRRGVFPMHCSANEPLDGRGGVALFFRLSGTGKTTLSSDSSRRLIGDDEHGWSDDGVFNFEGGCYAKVIDLSPEKEPEIYAASHRFRTVLENVVVDPETREVDFRSDAKTE